MKELELPQTAVDFLTRTKDYLTVQDKIEIYKAAKLDVEFENHGICLSLFDSFMHHEKSAGFTEMFVELRREHSVSFMVLIFDELLEYRPKDKEICGWWWPIANIQYRLEVIDQIISELGGDPTIDEEE